MTISAQASDARARSRQGIVGMLLFTSHLTQILTAINEDPQAVQIDDITIDTANDDTLYTVTINGVDTTIDSGAAATTTTIRDALIAALLLAPLARGFVIASIKDADELTLTGLTPGLAHTVAVSAGAGGAISVASVQVAATAAAVPFGRLVINDGLEPDGVVPLGKLAQSTSLTAQVHTLNIIFVASATYLVTVRDEAGEVLAQGETDADTNTDTTGTAIAATLNGLLPAASVLVASVGGGSGDITFTAELAGREFSVEVGTNEAGQAGGAIVSQTDTTGPSRATSVNRAALGISLHSQNDPATTIGGLEGEYAPNVGMRLLKGANAIFVERPGVVAGGDPVFVELNVTADNGKFFNADSATRVRLVKATWERDGINTADGVAGLRIDL
jgi:hypothetical protein